MPTQNQSPELPAARDRYDSWLLAHEPVFAHDLKQKFKEMAGEPGDVLRATFYCWSERLADVCLEVISAPAVRAVMCMSATSAPGPAAMAVFGGA
jgi:hypothetical protein